MNEESRKIIEKLRSLKPVLQKEMGIKRLRVFGSVARGEATPDSDVDLIADFEKVPGLIRFSAIHRDLAERIGKKVDLMTDNSIHRALRADILQEAQDV